MTRMTRRWATLVLPLLLSGCLLPPPDTPPVLPAQPNAGLGQGAAPATATAPGAATAPKADPVDSGAGRTAPDGPIGATGPSLAGPGVGAARPVTRLVTVEGQISGAAVLGIRWTLNDGSGEETSQGLEAGGHFTVQLAAGDYTVEFLMGDRTLRLAHPVTLHGGEDRKVTITLAGSPLTATWQEALPLETPSPSPSPTP
jgi:hypothetical protein